VTRLWFLAMTRCQRGWPRKYVTYHQEIVPPYRRAEHARVLRLLRWGLVVGRWDSAAVDEDQALTDALGARETVLLDDEGALLPQYRRAASTDVS
jgi:hypothetical protein